MGPFINGFKRPRRISDCYTPPFWGDGSDGILNVDDSITYANGTDFEQYSGFCIKQFKEINWNPTENQTLTVDQPCRGLILFSQGNVFIGQFGKVSMAKKGSVLPCKPEELLHSFGSDRHMKRVVEILLTLRGGAGGDGGRANCDSGGTSGAPGIGGSGRICLGGFGGGGAGGRSNATGTGGNGGSIDLPDILGRGSRYKGDQGIQGGGGYWHNNATGYTCGGDPCGAGGSGGSKGGHGANGQHSGGFILILAKGNVIINGALDVSGGDGGSAPDSVKGGPGGGAGGGVIAIFAKGYIEKSTADIILDGGSPGSAAASAGTPGQSGTYYDERLV